MTFTESVGLKRIGRYFKGAEILSPSGPNLLLNSVKYILSSGHVWTLASTFRQFPIPPLSSFPLLPSPVIFLPSSPGPCWPNDGLVRVVIPVGLVDYFLTALEIITQSLTEDQKEVLVNSHLEVLNQFQRSCHSINTLRTTRFLSNDQSIPTRAYVANKTIMCRLIDALNAETQSNSKVAHKRT